MTATVNTGSSATALCDAFFSAMDSDGSGFIDEAEGKAISVKAFGEDDAAADVRWKAMLATMDSNNDKKISKAEYISWWTKDTADKIQEDGTFVQGYAAYLIQMLGKITA